MSEKIKLAVVTDVSSPTDQVDRQIPCPECKGQAVARGRAWWCPRCGTRGFERQSDPSATTSSLQQGVTPDGAKKEG